MRYLLFLLILATFTDVSVAQLSKNTNKFIFKGKVIGQETGIVHLGYPGVNGKYHLDSCLLINGYFEFKGELNEPKIASFYGNRKSRSVDDPNFTEIFLEPTIINGKFLMDGFKQGEVVGSRAHDELKIYNSRNDSMQQKWKQRRNKLKETSPHVDAATIEKRYNDEFRDYRIESDNLVYSFIKDFPKSYVSAYFLRFQTHRLSNDSLKLIYNFLDPLVQHSSYGREIGTFISRAGHLAIGSLLPNFTQTDIKGNKFSLLDYRGKYVLIDFWASWCIPCRQEHPFLKSSYSKFRDKGFEIISVSLDQEKDKEAWVNAIQKDGLTWKQLCDFKSWGSDVVQQYNLYGKGIPASFLINPEGRILAKDLRGQQLEKLLLKYLGN